MPRRFGFPSACTRKCWPAFLRTTSIRAVFWRRSNMAASRTGSPLLMRKLRSKPLLLDLRALIPGISALKSSSNGFERSFRISNGDPVLEAAIFDRRQKTARIEVVLKKAGQHLRVHADGNPNLLGIVECECALKSVWSDSYNSEGRGVQG